MTYIRFLIFAVLCLCMSALPVSAQSKGQGFQTPAPYALIMDYETGEVLHEKNARKAIPPASMTKIMTAEMVFDRLKNGSLTLDTEFPVSEEAWRRGGVKSGSSTMFLDLNSSVRVDDLLKGIIVQSGNDACIVIAEGIAGSETAFADMMTKRAREIGLSSATFRNATGWPHPEHRISLYDLAKLSARTIREHPEYYALYAEREFKWNGITQGNRNPLLGRFSGADGLKTGHTEEAGYGLVASAERGGIRRIVVVSGLESKAQRRDESIRLMQVAFDHFFVESIFAQNDTITELPVYMGRNDKVAVMAESNINLGLHREDRKDVKLAVVAENAVTAPVMKGDHVANLEITVPGRSVEVVKLLAGEDIAQKSKLGRARTALINIIRG